MPADFEKQAYWHDRFSSETSFEWLTPSATFMSIIEPHLRQWTPSSGDFKTKARKSRPRILHLGSGTSDLHTCFRERGYLDVTNADYEPLALDRGRQIEKDVFGDVRTKYALVDVTRLRSDLMSSSRSSSYSHPERNPDRGNTDTGSSSETDSDADSSSNWPRKRRYEKTHTFDLVVDKGTADAVSCGGEEHLRNMVRSVRDCVTPDGAWISLSYSASRFDLPVEHMPFDVQVIAKVPTAKTRPTDPDIYYWCYLLRPR
ncbi:hypothetical protein GGS20DRAFT_534052 [Poronia punctata]|nr:hypothetical protein GGS20DRAFT_534052 [Poronia punctata]